MSCSPVTAAVEKWTIPTYPAPAAEEMPMFAEFRQHQGTTGNPYPNTVVTKVDREHRADKEWEVVRLENDYIRVCMIPALGGRVFEAFDKKTGYDFLYRQHVIKPALIGAFGSWISGGIEFNWPFHHRPSTFLPVDYSIEHCDDGSVICWLSECDPTDRTKGMVGIVLRPDAAYFETRVKISNRTETAHPFLWWENGAVRVHTQYQLIFPPDVTWCHHHYDRSHTTFPIAQGQYGAERFDDPTDISWHKNTVLANSYFAAPSKFDFFGGYDHAKECGVIHVANHHVSPGKKMFTWGYGRNADNWEDALTDNDGPYAELMAGSYTDDQPDFTYLAPYETKCFSQFWYPTTKIGYVSFANLDAAVAVDREKKEVRLIATNVYKNAHFVVKDGDKVVIDKTFDIEPDDCKIFPVALSDAKYTVTFTCECGKEIFSYTEISPDYVHIPKDNHGIPTPTQLSDPQALFIAGQHIDQYRDPSYKADSYYLRALEIKKDHLPSLIGMAEYLYRCGKFEDALEYANKAWDVQNIYDQNPKDGTVNYLKGLILMALGRTDDAYDTLYKASWSYNVYSAAMTLIAAIDGQRGDWKNMKFHAVEALSKECQNSIAGPYAALAEWKLGEIDAAKAHLDCIFAHDRLNALANFLRVKINGCCEKEFYAGLNSDPTQTALDVAYNLMDAGVYCLASEILEGVKANCGGLKTMGLYTLAYCYGKLGNIDGMKSAAAEASANPMVDHFPYRLWEQKVLAQALACNPDDGTAQYLYACLRYDKKNFECAAFHLEKAISLKPDFYISYRNLAVDYFTHLNRRAEALPLLKKAIELKPNDDQLLNEVSYVMASLGISGRERAEYLLACAPEKMSDDLTLAVANAWNAAGEYDKSLELMLGHVFVPGEGGEAVIAEAYMFGRFAAGREALANGDNELALKLFKDALEIPGNLHAGFWNKSVTVPYRYYEAEALAKLGKADEAKAILDDIASIDNRGMWGMGGEFTYFSAKTAELSGDKMTAQKIMRDAILAWEEQLKSEDPGTPAQTPFYQCFYGDAMTEKKARLYYQLGYGYLFDGDKAKAKEFFEKSLALNPNNMKCALELKLM